MAAFVRISGVTPPVFVNLDCVTSVVTGVAGDAAEGCVISTADGKSYAVGSQQYRNEILPFIEAHSAGEES